MKLNKLLWVVVLLLAVVIVLMFVIPKKTTAVDQKYTVTKGSIKIFVSTTGTVLPQNRLEIKPPLAGRIESILVVEGQHVKKGQTLAYMSSSDRAALLDAARGQGIQKLKQWEDTYKPIPLIAPIDGEVIVRAVEPGQSVTASDPVLVLSDRLIIQAQVDETDIGKIQLGQKAMIVLDAYSDQTIEGLVDHVYYESKTVNNVTMYNVDILPNKVPDFFRSGMSANIDVIRQFKDNILILPVVAIKKFNDKSFVFVNVAGQEKAEKREVITGISDDDNMEITAGLNESDIVVVSKQNYFIEKASTKQVNPFMPQRPQRTSVGGGRAH